MPTLKRIILCPILEDDSSSFSLKTDKFQAGLFYRCVSS
jgi:hypothetical protein